ncbi:MAG: A24 family peptidase [Pseudomonadota bacterium]
MVDLHIIFLILMSPFVGSFLGLVAERLPQGQAILIGRSRCNHCCKPLGARDLVPLFSWLINRGKCRFCQGPIPWSYNLIEMAAFIVAVWSAIVLPGWLAWATAALGWALLTLSVIDSRHLYLPDQITLPLIPAGLLVIGLIAPEHLWDHAIGAAAGFLLIWVLRWLYFRLKAVEGIGLGDAKLLSAAGAWVSWQGLPSVILIAAGAALVVVLFQRAFGQKLTDRHEKTAFGSYLAAGLWLIWLYGPLSMG